MLRPFSITAITIALTVITLSAQQLRPMVTVNRAFGKAMSYQKLVNPKKFEDLISYYPGSWIEGYSGTTVTILSGGKSKSVAGNDNNLIAGQIDLLKSAAVGDQLILQIKYYSLNSVTNKKQNEELNLKYTIVADQEASPVNGEEALTSYFEEQAFKKLEIKSGAPFIGATIVFNINEFESKSTCVVIPLDESNSI